MTFYKKFVEQHLSSARGLLRGIKASVGKPSVKFDESNYQNLNGNKQSKSSEPNPTIGSTSNQRHAKIDTTLDPASRLSTNQFNKDNQIDDDDIPF